MRMAERKNVQTCIILVGKHNGNGTFGKKRNLLIWWLGAATGYVCLVCVNNGWNLAFSFVLS
jgi:hypothetical protein